MELHLTPEQETRLTKIANHAGKPVEELLADAAILMVSRSDAFLAAVDKGVADADGGRFVEEAEMDARVQQMLRP